MLLFCLLTSVPNFQELLRLPCLIVSRKMKKTFSMKMCHHFAMLLLQKKVTELMTSQRSASLFFILDTPRLILIFLTKLTVSRIGRKLFANLTPWKMQNLYSFNEKRSTRTILTTKNNTNLIENFLFAANL